MLSLNVDCICSAPQDGQSPRKQHLLNSSPRPSSQYKPVSLLLNVVHAYEVM